MKVEIKKVTKLLISEVTRLDPITVILEDLEPRKGKIIIECYGESWSAYWGGMGDRTIAEFFCSCDNGYLSGNLAGNLASQAIDEEKAHDWIKQKLLIKRRSGEVDQDDARDMWDTIDSIDDPKRWSEQDGPLSRLLFEGEWWYADFPQKPNHKYEYLCRIIDTVKEVLRKQKTLAA